MKLTSILGNAIFSTAALVTSAGLNHKAIAQETPTKEAPPPSAQNEEIRTRPNPLKCLRHQSYTVDDKVIATYRFRNIGNTTLDLTNLRINYSFCLSNSRIRQHSVPIKQENIKINPLKTYHTVPIIEANTFDEDFVYKNCCELIETRLDPSTGLGYQLQPDQWFDLTFTTTHIHGKEVQLLLGRRTFTIYLNNAEADKNNNSSIDPDTILLWDEFEINEIDETPKLTTNDWVKAGSLHLRQDKKHFHTPPDSFFLCYKGGLEKFDFDKCFVRPGTELELRGFYYSLPNKPFEYRLTIDEYEIIRSCSIPNSETWIRQIINANIGYKNTYKDTDLPEEERLAKEKTEDGEWHEFKIRFKVNKGNAIKVNLMLFYSGLPTDLDITEEVPAFWFDDVELVTAPFDKKRKNH